MPDPSGKQRVAQVDALRGFALLGILLVNVWFFADSSTLSGGPDPATATDATLLVRFLVSTFFEGKFYLLFSLLFGYGVAVSLSISPGSNAGAGQLGTARLTTPQNDAVRRTARRLGFLAVLGVLHGVALFYGDILLTYAVMGALLLAFRPGSAHVALWVAGAITVAVALLLAVSAAVILAEGTGGAGSGSPAVPTSDAAAALVENARAYGVVLPSVVVFQGPLAFAAFYAGYALAALGVLRPTIPAPRVLRRVVLAALPLGLAGSAVQAYLSTYGGGTGPALLATPISVLVSPLVTLGYVAAVLLLLGTRPGGRVTAILAPVGRLSLTNYLTQSLVLGLVFTGYGLGLMDRIPSPLVVLVVLALFAGQILASRLVLGRFGTGPVEAVLRRFVYRAPQRTSGHDAG